MKRVRFRRLLRWALAGPITLLAILAVTFLLLIRWLNTEVDRVDHTDRVISAAQETQGLLIDMETGVRGYLLTRDAAFLTPYHRAETVVDGAFEELRRLTADNPEQSAAAAQLKASYGEWHRLAQQMLSPAPTPGISSAEQIAGKEQMDAIRRGFSKFVATEESLRAQRTASVRRVTNAVVATSTIAALFLGGVVGIFTRSALRRVAAEYQDALNESDQARVHAEALAIENERLYREAQSANRSKDEFLATLSHELRTPLTAILGWSRLLQLHEQSDETVSTAIVAIERSARAQAALVEDILDVSRIITGKLTLQRGEIDLCDAIAAAVDSVQPVAVAKNIAIELTESGSLTLQADPTRVQQIIWNLLSNSVKFSPSGSRVRIDASREGENVVLRVIDEGRGISRDFLPFVFDRFRQADSTSTREFSGLGIGLSVVKLLAEMHGGTVTAESEGLGKGATFTVKLPVAPPSESERPASAAQLVKNPPHPLRGEDVLIVDDDTDACAVIAAMVRSFGGRVETVSTAEDALRMLARRKFALVLTDVAMPTQDGFTLLRKIRDGSGPTATIPVVAVTALTDPVAPKDAPDFTAILTKPIDPAVLATTVEAILR